MYKRPSKKDDSAYSLAREDKLKRTTRKHPIQQIVSTLPQLAITFAILFFALATSNTSLSDLSGTSFYISSFAGVIVCIVFLILQIEGAEYKNWQQDPKTRQYIQIASFSSLISFIGFNISLWPILGILTPIIIICGFIFVLSLLVISAAFFAK